MSIWTHVAGVIIIDAPHSIGEFVFEKSIGKVVTWESPGETWDEFEKYPKRFTPTGSEGGIQYSIWENPNKESLVKYTVSIFGDLRDYSNTKKIKEWFNSILYDRGLMIRDAILHIVCDVADESIIKYDWELAAERGENKNDD